MRKVSTFCLFLVLVSSGTALPAPYPLTENSFKNPEFVKRFVGSYGFDLTINPQISSDESTLLNEIAPLMETNQSAAIARIQTYMTEVTAAGEEYSAALDYLIASLNLQSGKIDTAISGYLKAIKSFPNFYRAYQNLGLAYIQQGKYAEALPFLTKALEIGGGNGGLYGLIGYSYLNSDRPEASLDAYRNALLYEPDSKDWRLGKLNALVATGDASAAVRFIDELLIEMPEDTNLWMQQANSFLQLQRYEDAMANLILLRSEGKASTPSLVLLGDLFLNENLADAAVDVYLEASKRDDLSPERQINLVRGLLGRGSVTQAETLIAEVISGVEGKLTPDTELDLLILEARVALAAGDNDKAFDVLQTVVERDPLNGEAQLTLGDFYRERGDVARAMFAYEAAEKVEDYQLKALTALARLEVSQRNYAEAVKLLRRAQSLEHRDYIADYIRKLEAALASSS